MENEEKQQRLARARGVWLAHDFPGAFALYEGLLRYYPEDPEVLRDYAKAKYWEFSGQSHDDATRLLERAVVVDPLSVDGLLWLAHLYGSGYGQGYPEAVRLCRRVTTVAPDLADGYITLGLLEGAPGVALTREEAAEAFRTATRLAPEREDGHVNLAMESMLLGDFQTATGELRTAITLCMEHGRAHLADVYREDLRVIERGERLRGYAMGNDSPRFEAPRFTEDATP